MTTATLGGEVEVPTIDGTKAKVTIPAGTQHNDIFRLKNKGMKVIRAGGRRGDMYIHTAIEIPVKLTKKQKEMLNDFEKLDGRGTNPKVEKFLKKVRDVWADLKD